MTQHGDYLRRLRDRLHEDMVLLDEMIAAADREEDERENARLDALIYDRNPRACDVCASHAEKAKEEDEDEDAALIAELKSLILSARATRRVLRSVADLRDDDEQARAEHHRLRDGA